MTNLEQQSQGVFMQERVYETITRVAFLLRTYRLTICSKRASNQSYDLINGIETEDYARYTRSDISRRRVLHAITVNNNNSNTRKSVVL